MDAIHRLSPLLFTCLVICCVIAGCNSSITNKESPSSQSGQESLSGNPGRNSLGPNGNQQGQATESVASNKSAASKIDAAKRCLARGDLPNGERLVREILLADPKQVLALELAGDIAISKRDITTGITFYEQAIDVSENPQATLIDKLGAQWMMAGRPFKSLETLQLAISQYPNQAHFRQKIVGLMASVGMERESAPHARWLVQHNQGTVDLLTILSDLDRPQTIKSTCDYALKNHPEDLRPAYALVRADVHAGRWDAANSSLEKVVQQHPRFLPAQTYYLRSIVELGSKALLEKWLAQKPDKIETQPLYWIAAGLWADRKSLHEQSAYAFWRAVKLEENNYEALGHLARSLKLIGRDKESKVANEQALQLIGVRDTIDKFFAWKRNSQASVVQLSKQLHALGRHWESIVWLQVGFQMNQHQDDSIRDLYTQYRANLTRETPWQDPDKLIGTKIDLSALAPFTWNLKSQSQGDRSLDSIDPSTIRFADQAAAWGLNHFCAAKNKSGKEGGLAIYQTSSGGVGVVDFDLDGLPDLYLTTSDGTPKRQDSTTNRLYRNGVLRFQDVTANSNAADQSYSQGVAVGDYNSDGFDDLLIANIGHNRLLRNNGDGSFTDVSDAVGIVGEQWTTSIAMADIDGDGISDLFFAGYCAGEKPYTQSCFHEDEPRACVPVAFEAQRDQVLRGNGDGTFTDVSDSWLGDHASGYGFAIVAGDLDGKPGLDIYVANDTTANHYWSAANETEQPNSFRLTESATLRGLAFNVRSVAQASMGVAAGDADGDGDIDLFLAHFKNDYHTFYQQVQSGIWADRTTPLGLAPATDAVLGFGTQWIDTNNDGKLELIVGNSHIDDFTGDGSEFRMPTQLFYRSENDTYLETPPETAGDFFQQRHLVRAVATLDANVDGKMDAVATRIYDPVALLVNETKTDNPSIRLVLKGTMCDRDAIGAKVHYKLAGKKRSDQLLGGNGFQCTNEKQVTLGIGTANQIEDVTIVWPDQTTTTIGTLNQGKRYLVVQGSNGAFELD